ncbi:MAG: septum formation inhibitor Maf [Betaproteobacteria bacterium]|nr:septum formation inhibitor Maf [Betaproteobacteria bacterium]
MHDVNHRITRINQHPLARGLTLDRQNLTAGCFDLLGNPPGDYVKRVVLAKAAAALARMQARGLPPRPILVADTSVALGGKIFGKPIDAEDACRMLKQLSGRRHRVITAVACVRTNGRIILRSEVSTVWFARLQAAEIEAYVASGEPMDKAGAYGIQGAAGSFVRRIEGTQSGIMGLPLYLTARVLGLRQKHA